MTGKLEGEKSIPWGNTPYQKNLIFSPLGSHDLGSPSGARDKESTCLCRSRGFSPWVRKIPWRRKMATHSSTLAWKIPWTKRTWQATVHGGHKESDTTEHKGITITINLYGVLTWEARGHMGINHLTKPWKIGTILCPFSPEETKVQKGLVNLVRAN